VTAKERHALHAAIRRAFVRAFNAFVQGPDDPDVLARRFGLVAELDMLHADLMVSPGLPGWLT